MRYSRRAGRSDIHPVKQVRQAAHTSTGEQLTRDNETIKHLLFLSTMGDSYVIAIDFGTAFSGYAFNITPSGEESEIYLKRWGMEHGEDTPKTPTCILFGENEEFLKFGYEAKSAYINMRSEAAKKHYFFEDFKMKLYDKEKNRTITTDIKAANGKSMKALKVFLESLKFLKKDALTTINSHTAVELIDSDFTWVLTVPAIWAPSAKQFMREAATQVTSEGTEDKLVIALEPEAASIWCKKLPPYGFITQNHNKESLDQSPGTQYIVVDCGRSAWGRRDDVVSQPGSAPKARPSQRFTNG
uniref:Uncharacterized protein n=1 Tax=Fundulus heteroclitus TaxID=8078 RepID=A0A3Q2TV73_FUNHE